MHCRGINQSTIRINLCQVVKSAEITTGTNPMNGGPKNQILNKTVDIMDFDVLA